ncbi:MAG TPA: hypothetical protein VKR52_14585 [Terracidiphilus sp.]|nr:hypothetical protein [Terracidiphilus sp.]
MNRISTLALFVATTAFTIAPHLGAQESVIKANVPFEFSIGERMFPSGDYRFVRDGAFLRVENGAHTTGLFILGKPAEPTQDGQTKIEFDQVNGLYFLRKFVAPAQENSIGFGASKLEKEAQEHRPNAYGGSMGR